MKLLKLFEIQKELDQSIVEKHGLQGEDLFQRKILALQVELGELANEWRGFKFWSTDQDPRVDVGCEKCNGFGFDYRSFHYNGDVTVTSEKIACDCSNGIINRLLEEYVDCLHFILSLGIELNAYDPVYDDELEADERKITHRGYITTASFIRLIGDMWKLETANDWWDYFEDFIELGRRLHLTLEEVEAAYLKKNEVNHARIEEGY